MKRLWRCLVVGVLVGGYAGPGRADHGVNRKQSRASGGFPGEYLTSFGSNARAMGMGRAFTADAGDSSGPYWNPAGLAQVVWKEASFMYTPLFQSSNFEFVGVSYPIGLNKTVGISFAGLGTGDIERRDEFGVAGGSFSSRENAFFLTYAHRLHPTLDAGVNLKFVTQSLDSKSDVGEGLDLGFLYRPAIDLGLATLRPLLGVSVQNLIRPSLKIGTQRDKFPTNIKVGAGHRFLSDRLLILGDLDFMNVIADTSQSSGGVKRPVRWHAGGEYSFLDLFAVRGGLDYKEITLGAGVRTHSFLLDYAAGLHEIEVTHRFSLTYRFGLIATAEEKILGEEREQLQRRTVANGHLITAMREYGAGRMEAAEASIKKAMEIDPENTETRRLLAEINKKNQKVVAERHYSQALALFKSRKYREADGEIRQTLAMNPDHEDALKLEHLNRAYVNFQEKKYLDVKDELTKTLERDPNNEEAKDLLRRIQDIIDFILGGMEVK